MSVTKLQAQDDEGRLLILRPSRMKRVAKVLRCLIDTAERTTDMESVYNDKPSKELGCYSPEIVSWEEVYEVLALFTKEEGK